MWYANGKDLTMCEGDYGVSLPVTISGITFTPSDAIAFTVKDVVNGKTILTKSFTNI